MTELTLTRLVLDTNVVLDWLLFQDVSLDPLRLALSECRVLLLTHAHALAELQRVLQYPKFALTEDRRLEILTTYTQASVLPAADAQQQDALPSGFPSCRDPDDDPFVTLAYLARADALVSKDRQVLKLRRRVAKFGVRVLTPLQLVPLLALTTTS
jgi:uncharacterized protein